MKHTMIAGACALALALPGCAELMPRGQNESTGALVGGGLGLITAAALDANPAWIVVTTLGGAVAGTMVARNSEADVCAYANGDGTYYRAPCP